MKKNIRKIAYQEHVVDNIEEMISLQTNNRNYILERIKKSPLARIQIGTGGGKTTTMGLSISRYFKSYKKSKIKGKGAIVLVLVPSTNDLPEQIKNGLIPVVGNLPICSTNEILAEGKLNDSCIYVIGWAKIDKTSNKLTLNSDSDENLITYIEDAKKSGYNVRVYVDESHLERDNVKYLRDTLNVDAFIEFSATLDDSVVNITRDEAKNGWYNTVIVDRQDLIDAGLIVENIEINKYRNEVNKLLKDKYPNRTYYSEFEYCIASSVYIMTRLNNNVDKINNFYILKHNDELVRIPNVCTIFSLQHDTDSTSDAESVNKVKKCLIEDFNVKEEEIAVYTAREKTNDGLSITPYDIVTNEKIRYIITKDALQVGFDCPRCLCVTKLKEKNGSWTYEVQLLGRALRTLLGYSYKELYVIPKLKDNEEAELVKFNNLMSELYTAYVYTNNENLKAELTKLYGKSTVNDDNSLGRYGLVDKKPIFKAPDCVVEAISSVVVSQYKSNTSYDSYDSWNFKLSPIANSIVKYIYDSDNGFNLIDFNLIVSNLDVEKSLLNQDKLKTDYGFDFEVETMIPDGTIKDLDAKGYDIVQTKVSDIYKSNDTNQMKSVFAKIAKYLNIDYSSFIKILEHIFSNLHILSDGEYRLLSLSEAEFRNFLYRNYKKIEKLMLGKAFSVYAELESSNNVLETIYNDEYNLDLKHGAFCPWYYTDKHMANQTKKERKNHVFEGVHSDARVSKGVDPVPEEVKFEDFIELYNPNNLYYMHNLDKNKPGFCVTYSLESTIRHMDGYLLCGKNELTITHLNNFYPDYILADLDAHNKIIYISFLEIKHPVSMVKNSSNSDERNLKEKYLGLYDYLHKTKLSSVKDALNDEYQVKLSGAIVRRDDTSNSDSYKLCLFDDKGNSNYVNRVDQHHWISVKDAYELRDKLRNTSI